MPALETGTPLKYQLILGLGVPDTSQTRFTTRANGHRLDLGASVITGNAAHKKQQMLLIDNLMGLNSEMNNKSTPEFLLG